MIKSIISLFFICVAFVVNAVTFSSNGIMYKSLMGNKVEVVRPITDSGNILFEYTGEIVIPEKVSYEGEDYSVVQIATEAFYCANGLTSITFPSSLRIIQANAFNGCWNLESISFSEGLTTIEGGNFNGMKITSLLLPASLEFIGDSCFSSFSSSFLKLPENLKHIGMSCFCFINGLTSLKIGKALSEIGVYSFMENYSLTDIHIAFDNPVYEIQNGCVVDKLTNTLIRVPGGASGTIILPQLSKIGIGGMAYCPHIEKIIFPAGLTLIDYIGCANCTSLVEVTLPQSLTTLEYEAFLGCTNLKKITLDANLVKLNYDVFRNCSSLEDIVLLSTNPPATAGSIAESINYLYTTLNVPKGCINSYKSSIYDWRNFHNIIESENSGIFTLNMGGDFPFILQDNYLSLNSNSVGYLYDLQGTLISKISDSFLIHNPGIYILRIGADIFKIHAF